MKTTIDIKKALCMSFGYVNQEGSRRANRPRFSVHGDTIDQDEFAYPLNMEYPLETRLERARRLDILDDYWPYVIFTFTKYHRVEVRGEIAIALRDAYNAWIFSKRKNKQKRKRTV